MNPAIPIVVLLAFCAGCEYSVVDGVSVKSAQYGGTGQSGMAHLYGHTLTQWAERMVPDEPSEADKPRDRAISFLKSNKRYDVIIADYDARREDIERLWRDVLERSFGVRAVRDTREIDVLVLMVISGRAVALEPTQGGKVDVKTYPPLMGCDHSLWPQPPKRRTETFTACHMDTLAAWLEQSRDKVVLDETGLPGAYDFQLISDPRSGETIESSLESLGLELQPAKRAVRAIYIEPTGLPVPHPVARSDPYQKISNAWYLVARNFRRSDTGTE